MAPHHTFFVILELFKNSLLKKYSASHAQISTEY